MHKLLDNEGQGRPARQGAVNSQLHGRTPGTNYSGVNQTNKRDEKAYPHGDSAAQLAWDCPEYCLPEAG